MGLFSRMKQPSRDCARVARVLQSYLDMELDADSASEVLMHLEDCRHCGLEAATYRKLKRSLRAQGRADAAAAERLKMFAEQLAVEGDGAHDH